MQQRASSTWLDVVITHLGPRTARLLALGGPQPTQHHHSQPPLRVLHHLQYQEHHFTNLLTAATGGEPFPSTVRNRPTTGESRRTSSSSRGTSTPTTTTVAANATTSLFYSCRCPRRQRRIHERPCWRQTCCRDSGYGCLCCSAFRPHVRALGTQPHRMSHCFLAHM